MARNLPWYDDLVEGSFAGVRVYWPESHRDFGRRVVNREIPNADEIHSKDLGQYADEWQIQCFVVGPDYMIARDQLLDALRDKVGPHTMVDPWFGEFTVELQSRIQLTQSTAKGGMARFSFTVVLAKQLTFPVVHDPSGNLKAKAIPVKLAVEKALKKKMTLGKFKRLVTSALSNATLACKVANGKVNSALGFGSDLSNEIDAISQEISSLAQTPQKLANTLQNMWDSTIGLIKQIGDATIPFGLDDGIGLNRGDLGPLDILRETFRDGQGFDAGSGDVSDAQQASKDGALLVETLQAIESMTKAQVYAAGADVLAELVPDNAQAAEETKGELVQQMDELIAAPGLDADETQALLDLKAAMIDYMVSVGVQAAQVTIENVAEPTPALVLAHQLLGDATRDQELIRRNAIPNPMLVTGAIEVITDG